MVECFQFIQGRTLGNEGKNEADLSWTITRQPLLKIFQLPEFKVKRNFVYDHRVNLLWIQFIPLCR